MARETVDLPGLAKLIEERLQALGEGGRPLSIREAAERCGMSHGHLGDLKNNRSKGKPTRDTILKLAAGLEVEPEKVARAAGYLPDAAELPQIAASLGVKGVYDQEYVRIPKESWEGIARFLDEVERLLPDIKKEVDRHRKR